MVNLPVCKVGMVYNHSRKNNYLAFFLLKILLMKCFAILLVEMLYGIDFRLFLGLFAVKIAIKNAFEADI